MTKQCMTFRVLPLLAALFFTSFLVAQEVTVTGVVTDAATNDTMHEMYRKYTDTIDRLVSRLNPELSKRERRKS